jgi:hypothetical protein
MDLATLKANPTLVNYVKQFVNNPNFLIVKDAFTNHTPEEKKEETSALVAHGMNLGTRYSWNELEKIAAVIFEEKKAKKKGEPHTDPDLAGDEE